jgi:hypothetical protein
MPKEAKNWSADQLRFIGWLALPKAERSPKTQRVLAQHIGCDEATLSDWKRIPGFIDEVNTLARELVKHDVAEVLGVVRREAKKANLPYVNMVLAMAGLAPDIEAAGRGPAQGLPPVREIVVKLTDESVEPDE